MELINLYHDKNRKGAEPSGQTMQLQRFLREEMTNGELKEYLNTFPDDVHISLILANPTFCIDVGKVSDMDAELVAACEEDEKAQQLEGQMFITDFPEVMP